MRTLTANTQTLVARRLGTEPITIIRIDWTTGTKYYSDKTFTLGALSIEGKIYEFSEIQGQLNDKSYGQIQSASTTLSDIDGGLKNLFDTTVIEQRPVIIYHHYEGLTVSDLVPVLNGKVVSPITWNEGTRRLSFEINSDIDSEDLLLEIKEHSVDFPAEEDIGKVLPLCFGTPLRVPGVQLQLGATGELLTAIQSWTTWYRQPDDPDTGKITYKSTEFFVSNFEAYAGQLVTLEIDKSLYVGQFDTIDTTKFNTTGIGGFNAGYPINCTIANRVKNDYDYRDLTAMWVTTDKDIRGMTMLIHFDKVYKYVEAADGHVDEIREETNSIAKDDGTGDAEIKTIAKTETFVCTIGNQDGNKVFISQPCLDFFKREILLGYKYPTTVKSIKGKTEFDWSMLPSPNEPLFWTIAPGAKVRIYDAGSIFVVNSVPSTAIHEVMAKRQGSLVAVPSSYYTKYLDYPAVVNGVTEHLTVIKMKKPLSEIPNESWDDQIYVSLTSSIGPNTTEDVITWILANRITGLIPDSTTFTTVSALIENYPSHFAVLNQVDALESIKDFAWQARVGLYLEAGIAYVHYLSKAPISSIYTATISKIKMRSMKISKTSTDDVHPKFTGLWNRTYEEDESKKVIYETNKAIYTKNDYECRFSIYNIQSLVEKSARFWSYRMANVWVRVDIDTFLTSLAVQMWDIITVSCSYINGGVDIFGIVEGVNIDTATHQISLTTWLPLKQGDGLAYLDDSADTMPPNPAVGLSENDYKVPTNQPRQIARRSIRNKGRTGKLNAPASTEDNYGNTGDIATFRIVEVLNNSLKCILTNPDNPKENGEYDSNIDLEPDLIFWIAKYSDGNSGSLRVMDWHQRTFPDGINITNPYVTYTKLDVDRRRAEGLDKDGNIYKQEEVVNPPYRKADDSMVTVQAKYYPDGVGMTNDDGKIYWLEVSHRAWAKKEEITI